MPFIVYNKNNFSKIAIVNTLQEATNLLPNDGFDILEMEDSNYEIYKENDEIKTREIVIPEVDLKEIILLQLAQLDLIIPRVVEDIIEQGNFTIHQSKLDIINEKKSLRVQLSEMG